MQIYLQYLRFHQRKPFVKWLSLILLLAFSSQLTKIKVDNNMEHWFPEDAPELVDKQQFIDDFGNDELIFVLLTFPDSSTEHYKESVLEDVSEEFQEIDQIASVVSRADFDQMKPLMNMGGMSVYRKLERLYFEAQNASAELIYVQLELIDEIDKVRPEILQSIDQTLAKISPDIQVDITGSGVIYTEIDKLNREESGLLLGIAYGLIFLLLAWRLRSIKKLGFYTGLFLLLFLPAMSVFGWLDQPINMITMLVPILLLINFFAYIVQLMKAELSIDKAVVKARILPLVYSGLTTMIGFGSLMLSNVSIIQQFGLLCFSSISIGIICLLFVVVPFALPILEQPVEESRMESKKFKEFLVNLTPTSSRILSVLSISIIVLGAISITQLKVDTNSINMLPKENEAFKSSQNIEREFGKVNTIDFLISRKDDIPLQQEDFRSLRNITRSIDELEFVEGIISYATWRPALSIIKGRDSSMHQSLKAIYLSEDEKRARMHVRIPMGSSGEMETHLNQILTIAEQEENELQIRPVGYLPIYIAQMNTIVPSMMRSLLFALLCISITMIIMVQDIKLGLLAIIPNTFPLAAVFGLMYIMNIPFDIATSVIVSVIIGLVVDDTLHILWNLKELDQKGAQNTVEAFTKILRASSTTSIMFAIGFSVQILSEMKAIHYFGLLTAFAIGIGWVGDFIIFPALIKWAFPEKEMSAELAYK